MTPTPDTPAAGWHSGPLCGFAVETTGTDPETARIVAACLVWCGGGKPTEVTVWTADAGGEEIPEAATAVHGITTEQARTAAPVADVADVVRKALSGVAAGGVPIVAMAARFHLTVLDREARRAGLTPLAEDLDAGRLHVIDPQVLDRQTDPYRRGKRTLAALCSHYRLPAPGALADGGSALAACCVAWRIAANTPAIGNTPPADLHRQQTTWAARQAAGLQEYLRRTDRAAVVPAAWPLLPYEEQKPKPGPDTALEETS
ncbi:exonuclease domain-containing protein [Streptomyces sp. NPDC057654]|uniref:exonuclease domain-containing protein n=1 Tax=Streptomyces sp. NPDC057654 TaxID=3346196 RepID=UPI0036796740